MSDREMWEYFEKNKRQAVTIEFPDREEGEPQITEEQIEELKAISEGSASTKEVKKLGRWQAACAIEKIKEAKCSLGFKIGYEYMEKKKREGNLGGCLLMVGFLVIIFLVFGFSGGLLVLLVLFILSLPIMLLMIIFDVIAKIGKWFDK